MTVLYLYQFPGDIPSEKEERPLEGCRQAELPTNFESGRAEQCVSPEDRRASYWSSSYPSSLLLHDEEDI